MPVELFRQSYSPANQTPQVQNTSITPESMEPVSPIRIPPQPASNAASSFNSYLEQLGSSTKTAKKESDNYLGLLTDSLNNTLTGTEATSMAYGKQGGVDTLETELNDLNAQLMGEQQSTRRRIEEIEKNEGGQFGLTRAAVQDRIDNVERESLRKQADIAVVQMAKQGQYDSAKKVADRAVTAYLEKTKQRNDMFRFMYEESKEQWTKAEQREFETAQKEREREADNQEYRLRAEFDQKIKQADPLYQMQIEKTRKELALLGQPTPKELADEKAALKEAQAAVPVMRDKLVLVDALKEHRGITGTVGAYGIARWTPFSPDKADRQEFIGGVQKLIGGLTLDNLIAAKARGATFGALSDAELQILAASATAINSWALKDGEQVYGYEISEAAFKRELDNIKMLTERALVQSGQSLIDDDESALLDQLYSEAAPFNPQAYFSN